MSVAAALVLRSGDESRLSSLVRSSTVAAGLAQRARIVLLAAEGVPNADIARRVGVSRPTVIEWRNRYEAGGIAALDDLDRSGRPPVIDEIAVVVATVAGCRPRRWGSRTGRLGCWRRHLGISFASVARIWRKWKLQPWRAETFKFSTDPELDAKVRDVVGLYLDPPENAVVVCVDEKSQIQALDRTAPILPMRPGFPRKPPTTTSATAPPPCSPRWRSPPARSPTPATRAHPRRVPGLPQTGRQGLPAGAAARRLRQLRHPQAPGRQAWLAKQPASHAALHPDLRLVAEHGRDLLRDHHPPSHPPRHASPRSTTSSPPSTPSSTAGTNAATRSSGPRPPTKSSAKPTVNPLQTRDTRGRAGPRYAGVVRCTSGVLRRLPELPRTISRNSPYGRQDRQR